MESIFESQRLWHEERERCLDSIVRDMLVEKKTQKEKVNSDQRVKTLIERYQTATQKLVAAYHDETGERARELNATSGPGVFAEYYARLKAIKDFHRNTKNEPANLLMLEFSKMNQFVEDPDRVEKEVVKFSDEEGYGLFLDLHAVYVKYVNLKGIKRINYLTYLETFDRLFEIPKDTKKHGSYKEYLTALTDYLLDYMSRAKPLVNIEKELETTDKEFESKWAKKLAPGWEPEKSTTVNPEALDLSMYNSVEDLEALGLDRLKKALLALNLKCGGTLKQRAERLFAAKSKAPEELVDLKKKAEEEREERRKHTVAQMEYRIYKLAELVGDERVATKDNVERKQARGYVEEDESEEEDAVEITEEIEHDESTPYNPKGLPLGWDGKPIPYWLYKLHGLNISYTCEICGNQVYKGPKVFLRHFSEWRHSHGMRCLNIPNTPHFANITKIADALALWKKLQESNDHVSWNPELDEECEDSKGNVISRRTYEDLLRQGLL
uniref:Matrin-type domain-containing protein n=1 Tax=Panagrellus redivivus TaxID=6233 RepID=A0A7E4V540_PANRE